MMLQQTEHYYNIISLLRQNSPVIKYMLCYVISNAYCSNLLNRDKKIEAEDFNVSLQDEGFSRIEQVQQR